MSKMDKELCSRILAELLANNSLNHNRLFIYGNRQEISAMMDSFESQYRKTFPGRTVLHICGKEFIDMIINSVKQQIENNNVKVPDGLRKLTESDLLIFEDVDSLAGCQVSMEKLYFIIDRLFEQGKTIIFAAEVPPAKIKQMEKRNISQFEGCIVMGRSQKESTEG